MKSETSASSEGPLMLLDSAGLWFRAFFSVPDSLVGPHGEPINAVRGFLEMTSALVNQYQPSGLIAAMDQQWRPQWRVDLLPSYKLERVAADGAEDAPDALAAQVDVICELLDTAGVCRAGAPEAEADDVLATLVSQPRGCDVLVVTGDRDLFQLARPGVSVVYIGAGMKKQRAYSAADVAARFGFPPADTASAYADYAVLVGDASDGLPGVKGIGAKTAASLVSAYGSAENVLDAARNSGSSLTPRQRTMLLDSEEYIRAAVQVVRLGHRSFNLSFTADSQGAVAEGDSSRYQQLASDNGIERVAERFVSILQTVS